MFVDGEGSSLICGGLDHWYEQEYAEDRPVDPSEYRFSEWRLERELGVEWFGLPPDFREPRGQQWIVRSRVNLGLTVPFLRFPQWHVCPNPRCGYLKKVPLTMRSRSFCDRCATGRGSRGFAMVQVRFIALCAGGHIQDFPWREWAHGSINPGCNKDLRLSATGQASLRGTRVRCQCGADRSLENITLADPPPADVSHLTSKLAKGEKFLCTGMRPWLADDTGEGCGRSLRGSLRGATNVYYAQLRSSIFLPRGDTRVPTRLIEFLKSPAPRELLRALRSTSDGVSPETLRRHYATICQEYSDEQLAAAIAVFFRETEEAPNEPGVRSDDNETAFRRTEAAALRNTGRDEALQIRAIPSSKYQPDLARVLSGVSLCEKLTETRVLTGFARIYPDNDRTVEERLRQLWRNLPPRERRWLPAYQVRGEGIYIQFSESAVAAWERDARVLSRLETLARNYARVQARRMGRVQPVSPRRVVLHTLAHLLMNQLTFECGYSTAALRERLYVSSDPSAPLAGILIYTAAGDAEGTMGGLVRMGKPGTLESVFRRAVVAARWCSADPICMELGGKGQGPDSCNLAACHNCALVPETSCEEFNRLLDRAFVVGTSDDRVPGLLSGVLTGESVTADSQ
jgi:hypothetical protein